MRYIKTIYYYYYYYYYYKEPALAVTLGLHTGP